MSGGTVRDCTTCGWSRHCIKARRAHGLIIACSEWKPLPAPAEKKPVAGCEYCRPAEALYKAHHGAELHLSTLAGRRTLRAEFYNLATPPQAENNTYSARCAEFYINFCPHCGRDLRGD